MPACDGQLGQLRHKPRHTHAGRSPFTVFGTVLSERRDRSQNENKDDLLQLHFSLYSYTFDHHLKLPPQRQPTLACNAQSGELHYNLHDTRAPRNPDSSFFSVPNNSREQNAGAPACYAVDCPTHSKKDAPAARQAPQRGIPQGIESSLGRGLGSSFRKSRTKAFDQIPRQQVALN